MPIKDLGEVSPIHDAQSINNMIEEERRFQVFISSTYLDLAEERQEVLMALLELNCMPAGMELFPAANENQWSYIKQVIDQSDYYLLIIGGRYGSTADDGISFTEKEYDYALSINKPIISFIHSQPEELPLKKSEQDETKRKKLEQFKQKVQNKLCKTWTTSADLGGAVSRSVIQLMRTCPAVGYIKGDLASDPINLNILKNKNQELEKELARIRLSQPEGTENLSQGDDLYNISYHTYAPLMKNAAKKKYLDLSWDEILKILGPSLFDEESQYELQKKLETYISNTPKEEPDDFYLNLEPECFETIITQFVSLGIIEKSQKNIPLATAVRTGR